MWFNNEETFLLRVNGSDLSEAFDMFHQAYRAFTGLKSNFAMGIPEGICFKWYLNVLSVFPCHLEVVRHTKNQRNDITVCALNLNRAVKQFRDLLKKTTCVYIL